MILVSTKKGKSGETKFTYNSEFFINSYGPNAIPDLLNSDQFQMVEQLAWENSEKFDPVGWAAGFFFKYQLCK